MNKFLELFGGPIAVLSSIIMCIVVARRWKVSRNKRSRKHLVPLLYWGPVFLMACMALHLLQNGYNTIVSASAGQAKFSFYHYSLQLFGLVVAYQSYLLLQQCWQHAGGVLRFNPRLCRSIGLIILTTLPTFAFTPIGIVPSVVLIITVLVSLTVHRSTAKESESQSIAADEIIQAAAGVPA